MTRTTTTMSPPVKKETPRQTTKKDSKRSNGKRVSTTVIKKEEQQQVTAPQLSSDTSKTVGGFSLENFFEDVQSEGETNNVTDKKEKEHPSKEKGKKRKDSSK